MMIEIMIDSSSRLTSKKTKPQKQQKHFPYGQLGYLKDHPTLAPQLNRYCTIEAAYCAMKMTTRQEGYEGIVNFSEKSLDLLVKLVCLSLSLTFI